MGVYIRHLKIPKSCVECIGGQISGSCEEYKNNLDDIAKKRSDTCPMVEVREPHGRLIDADKLRKAFPEPDDWKDSGQALVHLTGIWCEIDLAPTVIDEKM